MISQKLPFEKEVIFIAAKKKIQLNVLYIILEPKRPTDQF